MLEGNQRFVAGKLEHPNQTPERRAEVAKGQHPFAAVLACSDSRTPPEIIFDRGLGDIFTVRVAGNVADKVVIESLDYSVKHLGVRVVMVLGHRRCGAVIAAVEGHEGTADKTSVRCSASCGRRWRQPRAMAGDPVENAVRENVKLVVKNLADFGRAVGDGQIGRVEDRRRHLRSRHRHDRDAEGLDDSATPTAAGCVTITAANDDA